MRTTVIIDNFKVDNFRDTLITALKKFNGISNYKIDINTGRLSFDYRSHNAIEGLRFYLLKIGHPIIKDSSLVKRKETEQDVELF